MLPKFYQNYDNRFVYMCYEIMKSVFSNG